MCGMCPDVIDGCDQVECGALPRFREDGTRNNRYMRWFTFDDKTWCKHLTEEYGTEKPILADHVRREHWWELEDIPSPNPHPTDCKDHCIEKGWYTLEEVERVIDKLRENE